MGGKAKNNVRSSNLDKVSPSAIYRITMAHLDNPYYALFEWFCIQTGRNRFEYESLDLFTPWDRISSWDSTAAATRDNKTNPLLVRNDKGINLIDRTSRRRALSTTYLHSFISSLSCQGSLKVTYLSLPRTYSKYINKCKTYNQIQTDNFLSHSSSCHLNAHIWWSWGVISRQRRDLIVPCQCVRIPGQPTCNLKWSYSAMQRTMVHIWRESLEIKPFKTPKSLREPI